MLCIFVNMLTSYDLLCTEKGYITGANLKESEIQECKESICQQKLWRDGGAEVNELHQEKHQLIKSTMSLFETLHILKVHSEYTAIGHKHF